MEYNNKEKTEGTKQQQTHRTLEWTNCYQTEKDWEGWVLRKGQRGRKGGITISRHNAGGAGTRRAVQHREDKQSLYSILVCGWTVTIMGFMGGLGDGGSLVNIMFLI